MNRNLGTIIVACFLIGLFVYSATQKIVTTVSGFGGYIGALDMRGFDGLIDQMEHMDKQYDNKDMPMTLERFEALHRPILQKQIKLYKGIQAILRRLEKSGILDLTS